jgi:integrase/recombinase XerD
MSQAPISPLRRRMIEDMTVRGFGEKTQSDYIRHVKNFTLFLGRSPDQAQGEDLRLYQVHQRKQGVQPPTMNGAVAALRFFFTTTCNRPEMARHLTLVRQPQKLPVVLTPEEVARLIEAAPSPKNTRLRSGSLTVPGCACRKLPTCVCWTSTPSAW